MSGSSERYRFSATLYKIGVNRCVDVPERVGKAFGGKRYVPVVAAVRGHPARTTPVPAGGGRYRLFLSGDVRKAAGVDVGDRVTVMLRIDRQSRDISVPKDVAKALGSTRGGRAAFERLTPRQRQSFLAWVLDAKKPETRQRRIRKGIDILLQMASRGR